jgi:cyclase
VNSHWHWDHTAGNQIFYESKRIISHSLCLDLMHKLTWDDFNKDLEEVDKIRTVYPNETIEDGSVLALGDLEVEFIHTPGHTPDSIVAYLKNERVIVAGDTVMELPYLWFGDSLTLIDSLRSLKAASAGKVIVQGHGGTCGTEKLDSDIRYVEGIRKRVAEYISSGKTTKEVVQLIPLSECLPRERLKGLPEAYGEFHSGNLEKLCGEFTRSG